MCSALFQRPKTNVTDNSEIWYDNVPVGHNTLGSMMARISRKAGLSRKYTNHSLRATAVNILDKAQFASRHIMSVTGHKAESSLKTYSGKLVVLLITSPPEGWRGIVITPSVRLFVFRLSVGLPHMLVLPSLGYQ